MKYKCCLLGTIFLAALCLALLSGCSDERKKEAAKLEEQLLQQDSPKPETLTAVPSALVESIKVAAESSYISPQDPEHERMTAESLSEQQASETLSSAQEGKPAPDSMVAAGDTISLAPREDAQVRSMPPHPIGDAFTVQIGSTVSRPEADAQVSLYVSRGYDAYISTVTMNGRDRYRVRIGRFSSRREAASLNSELRNRFSLEGWVDKIAE